MEVGRNHGYLTMCLSAALTSASRHLHPSRNMHPCFISMEAWCFGHITRDPSTIVGKFGANLEWISHCQVSRLDRDLDRLRIVIPAYTMAKSLICKDCSLLLGSIAEAQNHNEVTGHSNFEETTIAVRICLGSRCGRCGRQVILRKMKERCSMLTHPHHAWPHNLRSRSWSVLSAGSHAGLTQRRTCTQGSLGMLLMWTR